MDGANKPQANFIAGQWVTSKKVLDNIDPATGAVFAQVCLASVADVDKSAAAARKVHEARTLIDMAPAERGRLLLRIASELNALRTEGAKLLTRESGKRLSDAHGEFDEAIRYFEYYAGLCDKLEGRSIPLGWSEGDYTVHVPDGVTAHIVPWNFPLSIAARSLAPALATANCAIVKVPELAPMAAMLLGNACKAAGVPDGAVSILCGYGTEVGEALTMHEDVHQVVFTGSVPVGQRVLKNLSKRIVPAVTELGGKSAAVVTVDADLNKVVDSVFWGIFFNAGQVCSAMSRLIVPRAMQAKIVALILAKIDALSIGDGLSDCDVTPLISQLQVDRVMAKIEQGIREGATLKCGGVRLNRDGFFIAPTVFADVDGDMEIGREEVFGPVLVIQPYDTEAEALALANGTEYGLCAGVFSQDIDKIGWFTDRLIAGQIYVNEWYAGGIETPFGGMKMSGSGRDKGHEAIYNYLQTKNVAIKLSSS